MKILETFRKKIIRILVIKKYPFHKISIFLLKKRIGLKKDELAIISVFNSGETYMIAALLKDLCKKHDIKKPVILIGIKKYHAQIAQMFPEVVKNYYQINPHLAYCLQDRRDLRKNEIFSAYQEKIWRSLYSNNGIKQFQLVKQTVFADPESKLSSPTISEDVKIEASRKFEKLNLIRGKTVFLSPEALSIKPLPEKFWQLLADKINEKGYKVFLNIVGKENNIKNTVSEFLTFQEVIPFVELCENVVALRSGLCDVASSADANFQVIYLSQKDLDLYSLKDFFNGKNLVELIFEDDNQNRLIDQILENIIR